MVRDRSEWIWGARWRQVYLVVASVGVAALIVWLVADEMAVRLIIFGTVGAVLGLVLAHRRRQ